MTEDNKSEEQKDEQPTRGDDLFSEQFSATVDKKRKGRGTVLPTEQHKNE